MNGKKTVFITSFFGLISRNILATDTLKILRRDPNLRIVIVAPEKKRENYQKEFGGENVIVESISNYEPTKLERIFEVIFHNLSDTAAWRIHRLIYRKREKKYFTFLVYWVLSKLGYFKPIRSFARWLDYKFLPRERFAGLFEKYRPSLVFSTDIFHSNDIDMMREAGARGVFILGMVRSWDNITSKGLNRIKPDKLVVNTEKIKEEAIRYNDISPEDISVVGVPHYDSYNAENRKSREVLFKELGLDPKKKTIFFAPPSDIYADGDPVTEKIVNALLPIDAQLLLRLYIVGDVNLGNIKPIPGKIAIDDPGGGSDFTKTDLTAGDAHLADLLYHSDVVVAFASTLAIDAVVFDKPVVFIAFDGDTSRPYWKSLRRYYDYDHQKSILKTGGVKLASNIEKMTEQIKKYLTNPELDKEGRREIIAERCWKLDGRSGQRLASVIERQFQPL
ncbi:MAG: hypothetical protein HYT03_01000 [Candidatus Harrisonbacteria bacterium]|nr:hypothetical protein [Candidatus Harrisonbacteria bacterium]